jgi:UDP-N-acetylmuramate--alanine ligase
VTRRSASEIGAGLEPARPARAIPAGSRIHVVGAGGAAAAAAALHAHHAGARVSGCDAGGPSQYTPPLADAGIPLVWEHDAGHVCRGDVALVDRLAVTKALTAVEPDHPELLAARRAGIPATSVQQLIADAAATQGQDLIAIAGTHGKSTTTGWVVHLLVSAGIDPSAFVGALLPAALVGAARPSTVRVGAGRHFVVEADEYAGNFDPYRPVIGAVTNADWDHPDVFADRSEVVAAFATWIRGFSGGGESPTVVLNAGDAGVRELGEALHAWNGRVVAVALLDDPDDAAAQMVELATRFRTAAGPAHALVARWRPGAAGDGSLEVHGLEPAGNDALAARLALPGRHNAENGLVAAAVALAAGAGPAAVRAGLATFAGVGRRLELKGEIGGVVVLDDYGHHPTAMAATFAAVAQRYPGRRLWAVYEPLTYHRTAAMLDAFAEVLERADRAVVAQVHAGRDPDTTIASAAALADAVTRRGRTPAWAPGTVEETADWLADRVEPGDVVLVMGGGRSYVIAERLVGHLRGRAAG